MALMRYFYKYLHPKWDGLLLKVERHQTRLEKGTISS